MFVNEAYPSLQGRNSWAEGLLVIYGHIWFRERRLTMKNTGRKVQYPEYKILELLVYRYHKARLGHRCLESVSKPL